MAEDTTITYFNKSQAVKDAYSMLTNNIFLKIEQQNIRSLVVTGCTPKVGNTTLAFNLAVAMTDMLDRVLLVDADMRSAPKNKLLKDTSLCGMTEVLSGEAELGEVLCATCVDNLKYLPCGKNIYNPMSILCSNSFENFLWWLESQFDLVIIDTPSLSCVGDASIIASKADAALLVVELGRTKLLTLKHCKEQLEKVNASILGVVFNIVKRNDYKRYFESYNYFRQPSV